MVLKSLPFPLKENLILVLPDLSLKDEYITRFIQRGSSDNFVSMLHNNWDLWIKSTMDCEGLPAPIILGSEEYLETVPVIQKLIKNL